LGFGFGFWVYFGFFGFWVLGLGFGVLVLGIWVLYALDKIDFQVDTYFFLVNNPTLLYELSNNN
jgi:hypothetical protein